MEIIIDPDAVLGEAGIGEPYVDATVLRGYSEIAERRRTVPVAVVLGMLNKDLSVHRVQTLDGIRYVLGSELDELKRTATISSIESLVQEGDLAGITGRELRLKYGFASHLAHDRAELASALQIPPRAIEEDPSLGGDWNALRIDISGPISSKSINWIERSVRQRLAAGRINFLCVSIDSPGGSPTSSLKLANYLASLDPGEVRTVAFVRSEARADAALMAMACDHLVMADDAVLGGAPAP